MRKAVLMFAFCFIIFAGAYAQQIKASPLEGRWVYDESSPLNTMYGESMELVFFGNAMLLMHRELPEVYVGGNFTHTTRTISFADSLTWQYRVSGDTLNIVTDDGENLTYTRGKIVKSPIEGIWKSDEDDENYMLFAGDIMAFSEYEFMLGMKVIFNGNGFVPSIAFLKEMAMEYSLKGKTLTLYRDGDEVTMTRVYSGQTLFSKFFRRGTSAYGLGGGFRAR